MGPEILAFGTHFESFKLQLRRAEGQRLAVNSLRILYPETREEFTIHHPEFERYMHPCASPDGAVAHGSVASVDLLDFV